MDAAGGQDVPILAAPNHLPLMRPKALARLTASSRLWTPSL
jgi:hypothetical protein